MSIKSFRRTKRSITRSTKKSTKSISGTKSKNVYHQIIFC